ncbi:hypothetical protein D3C87_1660770 [compost metagenome]
MRKAILVILLLLPFFLSWSARAEVTMVTAENPIMTLAKAASFCRTLTATCEYKTDGSSCAGETYTGWYLPTVDEFTAFLGTSQNENYYWTRTPFQGEVNSFIILSLIDGSWGFGGYAAEVNVRCVR